MSVLNTINWLRIIKDKKKANFDPNSNNIFGNCPFVNIMHMFDQTIRLQSV